MKKTLCFMVFIFLFGSALFAEDANVLPPMTGRISIVPSYSFASGVYDDDGIYQSFNDVSFKFFNLGASLEYGINDWFTTSFHWIQGWTPWSEANGPLVIIGINDVSDLTARFKFQVLGERAPLRSSIMRFAVAPAFVIPLPELSNFSDFFYTGLSLHFDYILLRNFYISLYGQGLIAPGNMDKYRLNAEISPIFNLAISSDIDLLAGLPVSFFYSSNQLPIERQMFFLSEDSSQYNLGLKPFMSIFFKSFPVPLEFKLQYDMMLTGANSLARHNASFSIVTYIIP